MWYKLTAYNSETRYGWTDDRAVAEAAADRLNRGREINLYQVQALTDRDDETGGSGGLPLRLRDDLLFDADSTIDSGAEV